MPKIFLSHNHADKPFVRRLAVDLNKHKVGVWLDEAEIKVGDSLIQKISSAIETVDYLGVVLSPNSISSRWVQEELERALNLQISGSSLKILPILLSDCKLPVFLSGKLYADFRDNHQYDFALSRLLDAMNIPASSNDDVLRNNDPEAVAHQA